MSSLIGTVDHYVRGSSFGDYMERMNILYSLNNIPVENKKNLFITLRDFRRAKVNISGRISCIDRL